MSKEGDVPDGGQLASDAAICLFLTSIFSREYHFFVRGGIDIGLIGSENRAAQKGNF